jgi:hypothetical protein
MRERAVSRPQQQHYAAAAAAAPGQLLSSSSSIRHSHACGDDTMRPLAMLAGRPGADVWTQASSAAFPPPWMCSMLRKSKQR